MQCRTNLHSILSGGAFKLAFLPAWLCLLLFPSFPFLLLCLFDCPPGFVYSFTALVSHSLCVCVHTTTTTNKCKLQDAFYCFLYLCTPPEPMQCIYAHRGRKRENNNKSIVCRLFFPIFLFVSKKSKKIKIVLFFFLRMTHTHSHTHKCRIIWYI